MNKTMMNVACIDLEGVLVPEIWPHIGSCVGIPELAITTREEPNYLKLMCQRIALLHQHHLKLKDVQEIVASLSIFEGAASFLDQLREDFKVLIVSDAFIELAIHFSPSLGLPEIQCHSLSVDDAGYIDRCIFLPRRGKEETIRSLRKTNHCILAVGDAFNDLEMLRSADLGFLFRPSQQTLNSAGDLTVVTSYHEILHAAKNGATNGHLEKPAQPWHDIAVPILTT